MIVMTTTQNYNYDKNNNNNDYVAKTLAQILTVPIP